MTLPSILPVRDRAFMLALEQAEALEPKVGEAVETIRNIKGQRLPSFVPFLLYEYGLLPLLPYMANSYTLLDEGRLWQIDRGTFASVHRALGWFDSDGEIREQPTSRRWWNAFQVKFDTLPPNDGTALDRITEAAKLSVLQRSDFRRGSHHYDVPMVTLDRQRLDRTLLDTDSGIRVKPSGPVWSFGRTSSFEHTLTEAEGTLIGNWLDPPEGEDPEGSLRWDDLDDVTWAGAEFAWDSSAESQRRSVLAAWFRTASAFVRFDDAAGNAIGYRRCRSLHPVVVSASGPLSFEAQRFTPSSGGQSVYFEAMTAFDDVVTANCSSVALWVGGAPSGAVKPGRLWLKPDEMVGGAAIAQKPASFTMRRTVRERVKFLLRF